MFDKFKEFIGIDDNYDEYDEDQLYYDDEPESVSSSSRESYSSLLDDNDYSIDDRNESVTYESGYGSSTSSSSSYSDTGFTSSIDYKPETYQTNRSHRFSKRGDNIVSMTDSNFNSRSNMRISIQEPLDYEQDAPSVINDILDKKVVVLNLEMVDSDMRRRIFDFVSGAVYALDGTVEKVTKGIFVITPKGVEVDSSVTEQISDGNYNQL